jgi:large subunit ribosomal protein L10
MLTKEQKKQAVALGEELVGKSKNILFADFTGIPTAEVRKLRILMRETGGSFSVIKKRLLRIALKNKGVDFDPATKFAEQAGMIASPLEVFEIAGKIQAVVKDIAKSKKELKILGGVDLVAKKEITSAEFVAIAKLPSRETLLTQIAFMLTMPVKKVMVALNERAKQTN